MKRKSNSNSNHILAIALLFLFTFVHIFQMQQPLADNYIVTALDVCFLSGEHINT